MKKMRCRHHPSCSLNIWVFKSFVQMCENERCLGVISHLMLKFPFVLAACGATPTHTTGRAYPEDWRAQQGVTSSLSNELSSRPKGLYQLLLDIFTASEALRQRQIHGLAWITVPWTHNSCTKDLISTLQYLNCLQTSHSLFLNR